MAPSHTQSEPTGNEPSRFFNLPTELQTKVLRAVDDLRSLISLQMVCKDMRKLVQRGQIMSSLRDQYVSIIGDHYRFLTSLHIPEADVVHPPPGGWPNITVGNCRSWAKTPFVIDLLRHLPYIRRSKDPNVGSGHDYYNCINYKCNVIDYSAWVPSDEYPGALSSLPYDFIDDEPYRETRPNKHRAIIADGHESGGIIIALDTMYGEIYEHAIRQGDSDGLFADEYFEWSRRDFRNCNLVFVPGCEPLNYSGYDKHLYENASDGEEPSRPGVMFGRAPDQADYYWVRHLYRKHGWPAPGWKKSDGLQAVRKYYEKRQAEA